MKAEAAQRDRISLSTESDLFRRAVTRLILRTAVIVGMETYPEVRAAYRESLNVADRTILYLLLLESISHSRQQGNTERVFCRRG